jgi:hypothetical protein|tara:strand:+ start:394 stop:657 length:264 start_codon:yes stop_codon:yes gene_type:complete
MQATLEPGHLTDLAPQADLATCNHLGSHTPVCCRRHDRKGEGQVGTGFGHLHTPHGSGVDIDAGQVQAHPTLQDRQQQGQATLVDAL